MWIVHARTHMHKHKHAYSAQTDYFAASTAQTAPNIRQKLAIWDNKHKLHALQKQRGGKKWVAVILLIADKMAEISLLTLGREITHPHVL